MHQSLLHTLEGKTLPSECSLLCIAVPFLFTVLLSITALSICQLKLDICEICGLYSMEQSLRFGSDVDPVVECTVSSSSGSHALKGWVSKDPTSCSWELALTRTIHVRGDSYAGRPVLR